jgi:hypothetical protein
MYFASFCFALLKLQLERRQNATEVFEEVKRVGLDNMTEEECEVLLDRIRGTFQQEELQECAVCFEAMEEESAVILRTCKHIFCQPCLNQVHNCLCPFCRVPYTEDDMVKKADAQKAASEKKRVIKVKSNVGKGGIGRAPKIQAMLDAIDEMEPDEKGVIFSQWTYVPHVRLPSSLYIDRVLTLESFIVLFTALT